MSAESRPPVGDLQGRTGKPWYRALASRYLNVLPLRDLLLRVRRVHLTVFWTLWEEHEVRRLRRDFGRLPAATVAVVVPTFRRPALLQQAVASALAQTYQDFVVVVVDDGGGQVFALPDDPRLHVARLRRNTGVLSVVNNIGIRLTRSRYISLLNDDNSWRPCHLEKAIEVLEAGADLVYTSMRRHRLDGSDVDVLAVPFDRRTLRRTSYTDSNSLVVRRGPGVYFDRTPRSKRDSVKEDWEFVWRCSRRMRVAFVPEITVDYLIHDDSYLTDWTNFWRERAAMGGEQ
jgi:glycosyltransferase involved in cell wall biosynthesis